MATFESVFVDEPVQYVVTDWTPESGAPVWWWALLSEAEGLRHLAGESLESIMENPEPDAELQALLDAQDEALYDREIQAHFDAEYPFHIDYLAPTDPVDYGSDAEAEYEAQLRAERRAAYVRDWDDDLDQYTTYVVPF